MKWRSIFLKNVDYIPAIYHKYLIYYVDIEMIPEPLEHTQFIALFSFYFYPTLNMGAWVICRDDFQMGVIYQDSKTDFKTMHTFSNSIKKYVSLFSICIFFTDFCQFSAKKINVAHWQHLWVKQYNNLLCHLEKRKIAHIYHTDFSRHFLETFCPPKLYYCYIIKL